MSTTIVLFECPIRNVRNVEKVNPHFKTAEGVLSWRGAISSLPDVGAIPLGLLSFENGGFEYYVFQNGQFFSQEDIIRIMSSWEDAKASDFDQHWHWGIPV